MNGYYYYLITDRYLSGGTHEVAVYLTAGPDADPNILQKLQKYLEGINFTLPAPHKVKVTITNIEIVKPGITT